MSRLHFPRPLTGSLAFIATALLIALGAIYSVNRLYGEDNNNGHGHDDQNDRGDDSTASNARRKVKLGQQTFRFDTFGDESFWGDALKLHQVIEGRHLGGVGDGISPAAALTLGLKVDVDALPGGIRSGLKAGTVNLHDPATTLNLLRLNAVVGVTGFF